MRSLMARRGRFNSREPVSQLRYTCSLEASAVDEYGTDLATSGDQGFGEQRRRIIARQIEKLRMAEFTRR